MNSQNSSAALSSVGWVNICERVSGRALLFSGGAEHWAQAPYRMWGITLKFIPPATQQQCVCVCVWQQCKLRLPCGPARRIQTVPSIHTVQLRKHKTRVHPILHKHSLQFTLQRGSIQTDCHCQSKKLSWGLKINSFPCLSLQRLKRDYFNKLRLACRLSKLSQFLDFCWNSNQYHGMPCM